MIFNCKSADVTHTFFICNVTNKTLQSLAFSWFPEYFYSRHLVLWIMVWAIRLLCATNYKNTWLLLLPFLNADSAMNASVAYSLKNLKFIFVILLTIFTKIFFNYLIYFVESLTRRFLLLVRRLDICKYSWIKSQFALCSFVKLLVVVCTLRFKFSPQIKSHENHMIILISMMHAPEQPCPAVLCRKKIK